MESPSGRIAGSAPLARAMHNHSNITFAARAFKSGLEMDCRYCPFQTVRSRPVADWLIGTREIPRLRAFSVTSLVGVRDSGDSP